MRLKLKRKSPDTGEDAKPVLVIDGEERSEGYEIPPYHGEGRAVGWEEGEHTLDLDDQKRRILSAAADRLAELHSPRKHELIQAIQRAETSGQWSAALDLVEEWATELIREARDASMALTDTSIALRRLVNAPLPPDMSPDRPFWLAARAARFTLRRYQELTGVNGEQDT